MRKRGKQIHAHSILAQRGVNLIATILSDMGFLWTPTTGVSDAGIDGFIEIRQQDTGEATNLILQVQSKATGKEWEGEGDDGFWFRCDERDLRYWLQGNAPVVLIVSRPDHKEAYWVSIKDYFSDLDRLKTKKIWFNKRQAEFSIESATALVELARPKGSGLYLAPPPINEHLEANLLPIGRYCQTIYSAETIHREREEILSTLRTSEAKGAYEWFLKEGKLFSFHDLRKEPWKEFCNSETVQETPTDSWALSNDNVPRSDFTRLLNGALRTFLGAKGIWFYLPRNGYGYYYYAPSRIPLAENSPGTPREESSKPGTHSQVLPPKVVSWKSHKENERTVFRAYYGKKDPTRVVYYRHLAFEPHFVRFGVTWYLEITPTYHFTSDGTKVSNYSESYLSGIKRIEKHAAVHANVRFWGYILSDRGLFTKGTEFFTICEPIRLAVDFGIPEVDWLNRAEEEEKEMLRGGDESQMPLFE